MKNENTSGMDHIICQLACATPSRWPICAARNALGVKRMHLFLWWYNPPRVAIPCTLSNRNSSTGCVTCCHFCLPHSRELGRQATPAKCSQKPSKDSSGSTHNVCGVYLHLEHNMAFGVPNIFCVSWKWNFSACDNQVRGIETRPSQQSGQLDATAHACCATVQRLILTRGWSIWVQPDLQISP